VRQFLRPFSRARIPAAVPRYSDVRQLCAGRPRHAIYPGHSGKFSQKTSASAGIQPEVHYRSNSRAIEQSVRFLALTDPDVLEYGSDLHEYLGHVFELNPMGISARGENFWAGRPPLCVQKNRTPGWRIRFRILHAIPESNT